MTSKVEPSFIEDIKMAADLLHRKSGLNFYWGDGVGFMKNVEVTFSVPKLIYEWPLKPIAFRLDWIELEKKFSITIRQQVYSRSSQRCSMKKDVLKNLAKFTGKHMC